MNTNNEPLLPLYTRVTHFDGGPSSHGKGTIVGINDMKPLSYFIEKPTEALDLADAVGLASTLASGLYDGVRCPYVVQWDYSEDFFNRHPDLKEKYPDGYRDVYEPTSINAIPEEEFGIGDKLKVVRDKDEDGEKCEGGLIWGEIVTMTERHRGTKKMIIIQRQNGRVYQLEKNRFELFERAPKPVIDSTTPKWIMYRIEEQKTGKILFHGSFGGTSKQRRMALNKKIAQLNTMNGLVVSKRVYKKGAAATTSVIEWTKLINP